MRGGFCVGQLTVSPSELCVVRERGSWEGEQVVWGSRVTGSVSLEAVFFLSAFSVL